VFFGREQGAGDFGDLLQQTGVLGYQPRQGQNLVMPVFHVPSFGFCLLKRKRKA
jgi:hypothetical protein